MKTKAAAIEIVSWILLIYFFYEGIQKLIFWKTFVFWVHQLPYFQYLPRFLFLLVPLSEIGISVHLMMPSRRLQGMYESIIALFIFVAYICLSAYTTPIIFFPFNTFWVHQKWIDKIMISVGLCWVAAVGIGVISLGDMKKLKSLRNTPAKST